MTGRKDGRDSVWERPQGQSHHPEPDRAGTNHSQQETIIRPLTEAELNALSRWHAAAGETYQREPVDKLILANIASEMYLADHFERITEERLREIGYISDRSGRGLILRRDNDTIECHRDCSDWSINGASFIRRIEPRYMGQLQDIMCQLWGQTNQRLLAAIEPLRFHLRAIVDAYDGGRRDELSNAVGAAEKYLEEPA